MKGNLQSGVQLIYGRRTKRITLQRALVSKFIHYPERVQYKDLLLLYDNLLWCQDKAEVAADFKKKFGLHLKVLTYILKNHTLRTDKIYDKLVKKLSDRFQRNLSGFSFEKRNTLNPLKQMSKFIEVRDPKPEGVPNTELPRERYIGIGYRDKGTAKKPWEDGNQSWQEIASATVKELS
jgi:hypothetical protein